MNVRCLLFLMLFAFCSRQLESPWPLLAESQIPVGEPQISAGQTAAGQDSSSSQSVTPKTAIGTGSDGKAAISLPSDKERFHLFILAGQSNMAGRGVVEEQDLEIHPRVFAFTQEGQWEPAVDPLHFDKPKAVGVGLGKSFAIRYAEEHPEVSVGLVPCAAGGSPIRSWTPGGYHDQTNSHPLDDTLTRVAEAMKSGTVKGILWHQGESDCSPELAPVYEASLARLIDRLRAAVGVPDLPLVIGQMGDFADNPWNDSKFVIDAVHKKLARTLPNCDFASSLGLMHKGDQVHFDSASYRELGRRYYLAYQRIVGGRDPRILSVQRIWDRAPHNAFTDLVRYHDEWFCVFREGQAHVSPDGALRVIRSKDGRNWQSVAILSDALADLRDAKITITPEGNLMLSGAGALHDTTSATHQSYAWFSKDGEVWTQAIPIGEPNYWLWRVSWDPNGHALGIGYRTGKDEKREVRLYRSQDGASFEPAVPTLFNEGYANESSIAFLEGGTSLCLLRRDPHGNAAATAQLGKSLAPYDNWHWRDLGVRVGGPQIVVLPDGRIVAVVRLYDGHTRTSLCWLDPQQARLEEFLRLPSGGDTSYAGAVWHDQQLWISYYSGHESPGNPFSTAIYLARVTIP